MSANIFTRLIDMLKRRLKILFILIVPLFSLMITLIAGKIYQQWDDDPDRGAIGFSDGAFGDQFSTPVYLDQGWSESDSLWFYNTTQGSGLLPYDFFMALELADSEDLFRDHKNIDKYRYLMQKPTFFNPDGLPVGFTKDTYQGKDYLGYTCAACHTGQVNYKGQAIRIDGGPAMADMVGLLTALQKAMKAAQSGEKGQRFVAKVLARKNDYKTEQDISKDLKHWTETLELYNLINNSHIEYGYARLDAFGRIYNRVLAHVLNKVQLHTVLSQVTSPAFSNKRLLTTEQVDKVLEGINETIVGDRDFSQVTKRLMRSDAGYPGLSAKEMLLVRNAIFNEPSAPVSYPFLWDIAQSDYVQWNGLAANAGVGPIGRNTGEVIGVFGILDWSVEEPGFTLAAAISGQNSKKKYIGFKSSIDLTNLQRLEAHLKTLQSPQWPEHILGKIDTDKAGRGEFIYGKYCQSCHELIDRSDYDRVVIGKMSSLESVKTDVAMATHSVEYSGKSGNFKHVYQGADVGTLIMEENAPVVQILTAATKGVVATPDADKFILRRWADWFYTLGMTFFENTIKASIKSGNYNPDTTAKPYNSLLAYKARSLNGIWATAPYLHNGSVPSLYDLLLPKKQKGDPEGEGHEYRPDEFVVGSREFDPKKVGLKSSGYDGKIFRTHRVGDMNTGHEYAAGRTAQADGVTILPALNKEQREDLLEFLKTL